METGGAGIKSLLKSYGFLNLTTYRVMASSATQVLVKTVRISPAFALTAFLLL